VEFLQEGATPSPGWGEDPSGMYNINEGGCNLRPLFDEEIKAFWERWGNEQVISLLKF
jgi:hypothetical protein